MTAQQIITALQKIEATYLSMRAFFYQKIIQTIYTNTQLATYPIDYALLLPSSKFIINLNGAQVNAQMQAYIDLCNVLVLSLNTTLSTQTNLFYERIQNTLNTSISQMNGFSISLLEAKYANIFKYSVPYNMAFSNVLYLNGIDLSEYAIQASLNYDLQDFNNLRTGQIINLSKNL
jgi:hypothetical protein